jgi:membrane-bound lytic murein transglycosylase F
MMRCGLLGLVLGALLLSACTPSGINHEPSASGPSAVSPTPEPIRIARLGRTASDATNGETSIDDQVVEAVTQTLGTEIEVLHYERTAALIDAVLQGDADLAVGLIWPLGTRLPAGLNGFAYDTGELVRACARRSAATAPRTGVPRELRAFLAMSRPPTQLARAGRLEVTGLPTAAVLDQIVEGRHGCALAPAPVAELWTRYAPMRIDTSPLGVGFSRHAVYTTSRPELGGRLVRLFSSSHITELSRRIRHSEFGFLDDLPRTHYEAFRHELEQRLPRYEPIFREAAARHDLDWHLLAAVAYQESHWKPHARSPTGVRGMMMLTRPTAREVGVRNRLDAEQSIRGGARYLRRLIDDLPAEVTGENRLWLSLAAYNMGMRGLARAREAARERGLDPSLWCELSRVLRGAGDPKWREAGVYVERIRDFEDIIRFRHGRPAELETAAGDSEATRS